MYMAPNCAEFSFLYAVGYDTRMVCYWQWCISVLEYMGHARRDKEWSGVGKGPCACPGCLLDSPGRTLFVNECVRLASKLPIEDDMAVTTGFEWIANQIASKCTPSRTTAR